MSKNPFITPFESLPNTLPIFPLPGAIIMPGAELPLKVQAIDSTHDVIDASERTLVIGARIELGLDDLFMHRENLCEIFDRCHAVSEFLLDRAPVWLDEL